jgi:CHAT domain-containing protein/cytochrome c-type biogenesis protein CcmH/NrfG
MGYPGWMLLTVPGLFPAHAQAQDARKGQAEQKLKVAEDYLRVGQFLAAQRELEQALALYRAIADQSGQRQALVSLGQVYYRRGDYRQALQVLQQAERLPGGTRDIGQRGQLFSTQGLVYLELGDYRQALRALRLAEGTQLREIAAENRNRIGLGEAYHYLGWYRRALPYLQQAIRTAGDRADQERAWTALGNLYFDLGQFNEALEAYQQAASIGRGVGDRLQMARTLNLLGRVNRALGKPTEALTFYQQALELMRAVGDETGKVRTLNNLGLIYLDLHKPDQALAQFQEALARTRLSHGAGRVTTLIHLGRFYRQQGQPDKAIEVLQEALAWARKNGDRLSETLALSELGQTHLRSGQTDKAASVLQASIEGFESLRPGLRDEQKVALLETQQDTYRAWQKALVMQNQPNAALVAAERGRARAFVELLAQRLSDTPGTVATVQPPTLSEIQATARTQQASLVTYSVASNSVVSNANQQDTELYIWVVKPTGDIAFRRVALPSQTDPNRSLAAIAQSSRITAATGREQPQPQLSNLVVTLRSSVLDQKAPMLQSLRNGYDLLIQPIADLLPADPQARVVIIPQDALFLVPFPALQDAKGQFFIEQHTVLIAPSIQSLALAPARRTPVQATSALVVGNPEPMPEQLLPLPGAEAEAKAIAQLLNTQPLLGRQATETAVLEKLSQATIIHLATHGLLDDQQGLQSALALAAGENQDGLLTAAEILDLKLQANLAVLSACNTGRGRITGDGVIGLSRSLMSSGISSVIVSLWSVPDLPTTTLMTEFYRQWQNNPNKAQALRQAMLTTMRQTPNPRDWAGFILIGRSD